MLILYLLLTLLMFVAFLLLYAVDALRLARRRHDELDRENANLTRHFLDGRRQLDIARRDRDRLEINQRALLVHGYRIPTTPGPLLRWPEPTGHTLEHTN